VRRGHPWVYRDQLRGTLEGVGDIARIHDETGAVLGSAVTDPGSPIAARMWTRGDTKLDVSVIIARIADAIALRTGMFDTKTNAYRLVHGEGDRAPGVVVDRYDDVAVLRLDGPAIARFADDIAATLLGNGVRSVGLRVTEKGATRKLLPLAGDEPPPEIMVREHGVPMVVDLAHGQKTGAFLDQRENRRRVGELARDRRVLNLFSYTGGFSLHAAAGGAKHCTSVDVAAGAHATAQASFRAAGIDPGAHAFVTADVFGFLDRAAARGERFDLVISDPPNMAPSAATKPRAIAAYRKLHAACAKVLAPSAIFCAASCSSHVGLDDFLTTLTDDVLARDDLRILEILGAGSDHPVLPAFPEGRYLEMCILA
jgi:23S rRNA (cytosine1962-C5)-methyltransferase